MGGSDETAAVVRRFEERGKEVSVTDETVLSATGDQTVTRNHLCVSESMHMLTHPYT